jgi:hypothetical protein
MLFDWWTVHSSFHIHTQHCHLCCAFLPGGTTLQLEPALSRLFRDVREPKKVERFWPLTTITFAILAGITPKPKHPCLVRMQFQGELC